MSLFFSKIAYSSLQQYIHGFLLLHHLRPFQNPNSRPLQRHRDADPPLPTSSAPAPPPRPIYHICPLLKRRSDLDCQLTSLLRSSPNLLDLAISEASNLLTSAEWTASLASSHSSHVRHLNQAQSQVDSTLSMALASLLRIEPQMAAVWIAHRLCFSSLLLQLMSKSTIGFNPLSLSRCTSPLDTLSSFASNCRRSPAPEMGQGVSCSRSSDEHEFYSAVQSGDLQSVETALLSEPGLIHCTTIYDRLSALHIAAANGCIEVPSMLLDRSVQPDAVNRHKQTPLMLAAMYGTSNPPDASSLSFEPPGASPHSSNLIAPIPDPSDASIPAPPLFLTPPNPAAVPTQQSL